MTSNMQELLKTISTATPEETAQLAKVLEDPASRAKFEQLLSGRKTVDTLSDITRRSATLPYYTNAFAEELLITIMDMAKDESNRLFRYTSFKIAKVTLFNRIYQSFRYIKDVLCPLDAKLMEICVKVSIRKTDVGIVLEWAKGPKEIPLLAEKYSEGDIDCSSVLNALKDFMEQPYDPDNDSLKLPDKALGIPKIILGETEMVRIKQYLGMFSDSILSLVTSSEVLVKKKDPRGESKITPDTHSGGIL